MIECDWFEEDPEDEFSDAQRAFLAMLRERSRSWPCGPQHTQVVVPEGSSWPWCAVLFVNSQIENLEVISVGVCFDGASILAAQIHNQCFYPFPEHQSRVAILEAAGAPEHLGQLAADWLEHVLSRPVERREWQHNGRTSYEYAFSDTDTDTDTGTALCASGSADFRSPPDRIVCARGARPGETLEQRGHVR